MTDSTEDTTLELPITTELLDWIDQYGDIDMSSSALREFTCAACGSACIAAWSKEEEAAERAANGWGAMPEEDMAKVCGDCYKKLVAPPIDN